MAGPWAAATPVTTPEVNSSWAITDPGLSVKAEAKSSQVKLLKK